MKTYTYFYLKEKWEAGGEREEMRYHLLFTGSLPQSPQELGLGQDEVRSLNATNSRVWVAGTQVLTPAQGTC